MNRADDWIDHLGESNLPADEFTFTDGSNYGLDGFDFVTPRNEGVEQGARLPEAKGLSGLPDGIVEGSQDDDAYFAENAAESGDGFYLNGIFDEETIPDNSQFGTVLSGMLSEDEGALPMTPEAKQAASLADLRWLDPTQEQDPERLPKELLPDRPPLDSSPELEEAWGVDRRTDGISLVPNNTDLEIAQYEQSIREGPESGLPQPQAKTAKEVKDSILWAVRQSHYGMPIIDIKRGLIQQLGEDARRTVQAMKIIEDEHGLAGKVFIRASAFPGLRNGKWVKELRKIAQTAHYVITDDETIGKKLGMESVSDIPWKSALDYYRDWLGISGYKVANEGDPRTILKQAFLMGPQEKIHEPTPKPIVKIPEASLEEATEAMKNAKVEVLEVESRDATDMDKKIKGVAVKLARWVKDERLTKKQAFKILKSGKRPEEMIKVASLVMETNQIKKSDFKGPVMKEATPSRPAPKKFDERLASLAKESGQKTSEIQNVVKWARQKMNEGLAGLELDQMLHSRFSEPLIQAAGPLLKEVRESHEGLSGFLYVDADAYATSTGVTGCNEGGLKHRANALKFVLSMPRCASCTQANADGVCQNYNKVLVGTPPVKDVKAYQKKAIELASATDHELTASMFNPNEFNLTSPLEGEMELESSVPAKTLGDILFGGTEL